MGVTQILFWFLSAMAIGSAIMVITANGDYCKKSGA